MASQEERRAENETTFREANERIREASDRLQPPMDRVPFVCECADTDCRQLVTLTPGEYEHVRAEPTQFLVAPGHEQGAQLSQNGDYAVVAKRGVAGAVARDRDPRQDG